MSFEENLFEIFNGIMMKYNSSEFLKIPFAK